MRDRSVGIRRDRSGELAGLGVDAGSRTAVVGSDWGVARHSEGEIWTELMTAMRFGQTRPGAVNIRSGLGCRIGLWRDADDVQPQSARRAEPTEIDPTHGAGPGLPFRTESVTVAVEDVVDVSAAAEDQAVAQITNSTA
jgi:hypothetical protein